jgi:hypothetical protein
LAAAAVRWEVRRQHGSNGGNVALVVAAWHWWRRRQGGQHGGQRGGSGGGEGCANHVLKIFFIPLFLCSFANIVPNCTQRHISFKYGHGVFCKNSILSIAKTLAHH